MSEQIISKRREDYSSPSHLIKTVDIKFYLNPHNTTVINTMFIERQNDQHNTLVLDGEDLIFNALKIDGVSAIKDKDYVLSENRLTVLTSKSSFVLEVTNTIKPIQNTSLEGLYYSKNAFCTQCEAEGFRKITYFLDRPDVLSIYCVSLISDMSELTYLLSNGNLVSDTSENNVRTCVWQDPHPKPCYLFALVAGHFDKLQDNYTTGSGREVSLQLFVDEGRLGQGHHALASLKKAMQWDEDAYGLEYDLDIYMVVAVDFFNMGAMENKGLNVFNSKFVLADPNTATDEDYFNIESIIAHEYFHNWTGNRVTCRDWFQLSLKEGLTVFRDQQFSADMFSDLITRISQVKVMREHQFAEDASPMSHPIRPEVVMEMNNFYTVTVYDKGAEVIRMLHTLLGKQGFRSGMNLYFERHDGQAVTCDDFVNAMQDANKKDLSHFKLWYSQSGTPVVKVSLKDIESEHVDAKAELIFEQINHKTADQTEKLPLYIPIKLECFDNHGNKLESGITDDTFVLEKSKASLLLPVASENITPSLLQNFSAPVIVEFNYSFVQLINIIKNASSFYAKWEASQRFFIALIKAEYNSADKTETEQALRALAEVVSELSVPKEVLAQIITLPSVESVMATIEAVNPIVAVDAHSKTAKLFATHLQDFFMQVYLNCQSTSDYAYEKNQVNVRRLKNTCLLLLAKAQDSSKSADNLILTQYQSSANMTDKLGALKAAQVNSQRSLFHTLMLEFESEYGHDSVIMDKWFALHATTERPDILSHLDLLQSHPQFSIKNPNKVRSLVGSFAFYNIKGFHDSSGNGYTYVADYLMKLDTINPQVASRIITPLIQFSGFDKAQQKLIKRQLERIFAIESLSKDLFEKISKSLIV